MAVACPAPGPPSDHSFGRRGFRRACNARHGGDHGAASRARHRPGGVAEPSAAGGRRAACTRETSGPCQPQPRDKTVGGERPARSEARGPRGADCAARDEPASPSPRHAVLRARVATDRRGARSAGTFAFGFDGFAVSPVASALDLAQPGSSSPSATSAAATTTGAATPIATGVAAAAATTTTTTGAIATTIGTSTTTGAAAAATTTPAATTTSTTTTTTTTAATPG